MKRTLLVLLLLALLMSLSACWPFGGVERRDRPTGNPWVQPESPDYPTHDGRQACAPRLKTSTVSPG